MPAKRIVHTWSLLAIAVILCVLPATASNGRTTAKSVQTYEYSETRQLVAMVKDAAELIRTRGESAFTDFRVSGSRWRQGETYIFVLDPAGRMLVHPDPEMEGKNELELKDISGKPIIRGLIGSVTAFPNKPEGWYHYEWPVPGGLFPRWKSSYVRLVNAPSGKSYIVASGMYNDRMERAFVEDLVKDAVAQIEKHDTAALASFHDPKDRFIAKDAYVFVYDLNGTNLALPAFPTLEGRNLLDMKDTHGKQFIREMLKVVQTSGSGWVDYMWPRPGESVSTQKSSFVSKAKMGEKTVLVGCGVYLADAPKAARIAPKMTAPELMSLVRDGAAALSKDGENAYTEFRKKGSRWFCDDTYLFVFDMNGTRVFHAADPATEGENDIAIKDALGRPFCKMFLDVAKGRSGEGWVHYMFPEPGNLFPTWKSAFVKRVTFPSGKSYVIGSGIYNMQMDKAFIEDVVDRASALVADQGPEAFGLLRDKTGPFVFMDTYVFVDSLNGVELVNPAQPSLEGKDIYALKDVKGKSLVEEYIAAAMKSGSAWVEYYWYKPGQNTPARKQAYVRMVYAGQDAYIIGSGLYVE